MMMMMTCWVLWGFVMAGGLLFGEWADWWEELKREEGGAWAMVGGGGDGCGIWNVRWSIA